MEDRLPDRPVARLGDGAILPMPVALSQEFGSWSSGETMIIASTEGNPIIQARPEEKVGLSRYRTTKAFRIDARAMWFREIFPCNP